MSGWEKSAGCWGCSLRAPLGPRGIPSPEMSPRYLGGENKRGGEVAARAIYCPLPNLFKVQLSFTNIYLVAMYKSVLYAWHHTLCPRQPGCPVLTSTSSVAAPCPPYLHLGLRGRASLPDVHRKQGWGWAGRDGEKNGASGGRWFRTDVLPYCSSPEPLTPGSGSAGRAAEIVPESNDNDSNHNNSS